LLLQRLKSDPLVYAQKLNPAEDTVLLVELTGEQLASHSFLDDRIFHPEMAFEWVPWDDFESEASQLAGSAPSYIFHIGHCGSTLLSRLVAEATDSQALREPLPLRLFAANQVEPVIDWLDEDETGRRLALFEKTWARGERPVTVKATSMCTNLLHAVDKDSGIVFIYQPAETHLAVILAGENAMQDLAGFGRNRHMRLATLTDDLPPLEAMSAGELAAMTWLAEVSTASQALGERAALRLNFDDFLQRPGELLASSCEALGLEADSEHCEAAVGGPIMRTYSKAPEHAYGPKFRDDIIAESKRRNAEEIAKGMRLVERLRSTTCGADWH
jgi:hypothetical protein